MEVIAIIVACLAFFAAKGIYDSKKRARLLRQRVINSYGTKPNKTLDEGRSASVVYYNSQMIPTDCHVDDITWNDLDMDRIYFLLNSCKSSIGDEYLYYALRNPISDVDRLKERDRVISEFENNESLRTELGIFLSNIGSIKNISVYEYICRLKNVNTDSNLRHILQVLLLLAANALIFFNPTIGIIATIAVFIFNVSTYFKAKSQIECYFSILNYMLAMLRTIRQAGAVKKADTNHVLDSYFAEIDSAAEFLTNLTRGSELFLNSSGSDDILQSIFEYLRMAFHLDIIRFNTIVGKFMNRQEEFNILFENLGLLDTLLAVASYRAYEDTTKPELSCITGSKGELKVEDIAHPLLSEPVPNSLSTDTSILLTGSNASGKSTFLRTIAINAILAQSIYTVRATSYQASCFRVKSSIALSDSLESGESYYIVEIKSIKRILDSVGEEGIPVLCFIDEVLRGTNTVERIAAGAEIMETIAKGNALCFAATHDIELTYILENIFRNCHFEEQIENDEVTFSYRLHEGRATSRNAIRLLGLMGFDKTIVEAAARRADSFKQV